MLFRSFQSRPQLYGFILVFHVVNERDVIDLFPEQDAEMLCVYFLYLRTVPYEEKHFFFRIKLRRLPILAAGKVIHIGVAGIIILP